jgi:uncharacterized protein
VIVRKDDLRPEGLHLDLQPTIGPLVYEGGLAIEVRGASLSAHAAPERDGVRCRGRLRATAEVPCSRCLEPYSMEVDREFDARYLAFGDRSSTPQAEHQIRKDEFDVSYLDEAGAFSTDDLAAEQIYLSIPMKPLCREDCRGLCAGCGANLNTEVCRCGGSGRP